MAKEDAEKKVLIIDDDNLTASMLVETLRSQGRLTQRASDGKEGVSKANDWHPEVILLDLVMPGMDGIETCEAIRVLDLPQRPSIIMVSTRGDKKIIAEALSRGADDFIVKPVDELELVARINAQARIADFYKEVETDRKNLEIILSITKSISATLDTQEVLDSIVREVASVMGAVRCSIVLVAKDNEGYVLASHDNPRAMNLKLNLKKYPEIREVISMKKPLVVEDMVNHPLMQDVKELIRELKDMSVLVVPIVFNEEVLGTLFLRTRKTARTFLPKEINFCQIIANSSYHAIKNAKLFEKVQREKETLKLIAITDHLTELYNHNFFYTRLEEEFERALRYDNQLSLIMMDIDEFKRINDLYGHRAGDTVLKELADIIRKCVRKIDIVARYGGEEFAVILPQTPIGGATKEAERIRSAVEEHCYANLIKEKITMSLGVAIYPFKGVMNSGDLVNLADKALYQAKLSGRNCVRVWAH